MEERWKEANAALEEFKLLLAPRVCQKLTIKAANDGKWSEEQFEAQKKTGIFTKEYGVYLIYNDYGGLEYVGLAMFRFDSRIWSHDGLVSRRWTDVISMPYKYYFLAPALECFLILRLRPKHNKTYRNFTLPPLMQDTSA